MFFTTIATISVASILTSINWNFMIAFIVMCLTAMGVLVKIYGRKRIDESILTGESIHCKMTKEQVDKIEISHDELQDMCNILKTDVTRLQVQSENAEKSLDDLKKDNREIVQRMDDLLKQMLSWLNET